MLHTSNLAARQAFFYTALAMGRAVLLVGDHEWYLQAVAAFMQTMQQAKQQG